ncbi:hypothetical protein [Planctobacterium marinum]|uniref:Uncharacterized protein n=1 Tax=Planctobacterium marinum TaxID=1631968 RepID=A0AA48I1I8_9ALTE|nr:hypothetical protein MACH26_40660 [Planctobacterium marinum]
MINTRQGVILLVIAATIAFLTALAHLSCIYFGPQCYEIQMAPPDIVESAWAGTLLAPVGAVVVSIIFAVLGCYALSGAKLMRKLPLLKFGLYSIAVVCIIRGILPLQLWLRHPEKVSAAVLLVGLVWLGVGLCYLLGYRAVQSKAAT